MIRSNIALCLWKVSPNFRSYSLFSSDHQYENLISLLQSCKHTIQIAQIHCLMVKSGLDTIPFPLSKLLARICLQDICYASSIFREIKSPNLYMFNTMLRGYSLSDDPQKGLVFFSEMIRSQNYTGSALLDQFTFVSVLKSCSHLLDVWSGIQVHKFALALGFDSFLNVKNALLHFYSVCGSIGDAHRLFGELAERKDLVSWNTLMGGYLHAAQHEFVLLLFKGLCRDNVGYSVTTMVNVLSALGETRNFSLGDSLHTLCIKVGFLSNLNVATALISMYGKHGCIRSGRRIFDAIVVEKDVVLWNCMIDAYVKNGLLKEALELLRLMKESNVQPNSSTLAGLLSSCSASVALSTAEWYVHEYMKQQHQQLEFDVILGTALVDTYVKSGLLRKAIDVFDKMESKDVRCWTAMISGLGLHGQTDRAVGLFRRMEEEGFTPNEVTFLAVLNSCSHGGLVTEGVMCLKRMVEVYRLVPKIEHYGCLVDLLGRAGLLEEAYEVIKGLPVEKDTTAWRALLGACRTYGCIELAECVKLELEEILGEHPADSLVLSGTYAALGMPPGQKLDKKNHLQHEHVGKEAGYSAVLG
ncbi:pentatricopeptide repeat-containing protein At1g26900, mitochondrial [Andrographis paniculata]|uniref:pentatricopeptide repeat-containing protein At1g26900, mitochondrial n=1 Tax=Andrographis paniculata TaxID=175694 RepID=UPI0021E6F8D9|nr:pentatricopeptide repeat-containing protein At1g26900, mitochondrial [Andrographis paniculata]XP_051148779.1 pentatricopeptide repeat-containing protein At1g26900, mitochondrial [Andrographis paniculata]XP_051148780.1 pentatricopeptide repeat-containing protein At1g26900, mitochondrial [Andrographis paniculata]